MAKDLLSFEDFAGGGTGSKPTSSSPGQRATPPSATLSYEEFTGSPPAEDSPFAGAFDTTLKGLKAVGGEAAALADLVLSVPGFLVNVGAQLGGTVQAAARGVPMSGTGNVRPDLPTPTDQVERRFLRPIGVGGGSGAVTAYSVGREAGMAAGEPLMNPLKKVMDLFKSGEAYENAKTTKGMEQLTSMLEEAGVWAEKTTGGRVSRDAVPMLAETLMASATALGGKKGGIDPSVAKRMREQAKQLREQAEADLKAETLTPEEFQARVPVQKQINDLLGIRTPEEQAALTRKRRQDVQQAFAKRPAEGSEYGSAAESIFRADERMSNEARYAKEFEEARVGGSPVDIGELRNQTAERKDTRIGQAEILRIMQKPGHERTAEDLITLREARKQGGNVTQEAAMLLGAAGIGATVGATLSDDQLRGAVLGGLSAAAPLTLMRGGGKVPKSFGQAGAVKGPGGMWHPEAVERLSAPLWATLTRDLNPGDLKIEQSQKSLENWSDKAIRNYLNKYAGTERDVLKDVEIPFGGGTKKWGEVFDKAITKKPIKGYEGALKDMKIEDADRLLREKPNEPVFNVDSQLYGRVGGISDAGALTQYLGHVGDYLRQNVKPEDLSRYDLVRAVQETAKNDAKMAKQMEKAAADTTKSLPVHKAYPDGFKWVELKLPEKLTEEQAKGVKPITEFPELRASQADIEAAFRQKYVAVGADGKPIKNAYTDEYTLARTPEEAWLAGRLAEEGNQMGHCVGGYCPSVASGESRIFSLRDPKGKSHVTVEVQPNAAGVRDMQDFVSYMNRSQTDWAAQFQGLRLSAREDAMRASPEFKEFLAKRSARELPDDIVQIKGKQNRAPNKEYLPYVQDFVKEGKWGEVGDLENAGMGTGYSLAQEVNLLRSDDVAPDLYKRFFKDQRVYTREEFDKILKQRYRPDWQVMQSGDFNWHAVYDGAGRRVSPEFSEMQQARDWFNDARIEGRKAGGRQEGRVSQEMVVGLTGLGLGGIFGWAMTEDPSGALLGALAGGSLGLPGARARLEAAAKMTDYGLGLLSTRIGDISPALKLRGREYERRVLTQSHETLRKVAPFMQELNKLPETKRAELDRAILNNDRQKIADLMKGNQPLVAAWRQTRNVLDDLGKRLVGHGRFKTMLDDYFPRLVKDVEGLKAALNLPERTRLEQALLEAEKKSIKNRGTPLSSIEQSAIINREIQGFRRARGYQPGYAKQRGVKDVTEQLQPFYHTPEESLYAYVRGAVQDLELARFFGKDLVQTEIGGQRHTNLEGSIGNLVGRELAEGKITHKQAQELISMLQSRFQAGERSPNRLVQEVRNLGNMGLLGNVVSATTQLGDTALAIYAQDLRSTLTAVARQISGREKITPRDFGLADHIAEEFVSTTKTADWLNKMFKYSGFSAIDRFGKTTHLNAALARAERLSRTPGGIKQLQAEYGKAFGDEFPLLVEDLKRGEMTERVRAYIFSELSDMQPVSKLEMPQAYLDNPNGRLIYMLKTFMLKQMDVIRRDAYGEIKKGNVAKGLKNLTEYAIILGLSGAATQMIKDWIMGNEVHFEATDILENTLKTFGWGAYTRDKAMQGKPVEAIVGAAAPPYKMMDDILRRDPKATSYIPIVGKLYYQWELGGRERAEISRSRQTGAELSEEAKAYQRELRERRRARE